ncbi:MAG: Gfo/Idh/MocA family oxidoreductase [Bacteroidota bacterium]
MTAVKYMVRPALFMPTYSWEMLLFAYSKNGYGYALEKADTTVGWTFPVFEEAFNQGYPHELKHFIDCVRQDKQPLVTGEDGRAVLEIIYAAYASAAQGKKIMLPFHPVVAKPIDLWLEPFDKK